MVDTEEVADDVETDDDVSTRPACVRDGKVAFDGVSNANVTVFRCADAVMLELPPTSSSISLTSRGETDSWTIVFP